MNRAIIGIGSNIESAYSMVSECCKELEGVLHSARFSAIYKTKAVGSIPQPDYHNCVAIVESEESFEILKLRFKDMERKAGRSPQDKLEGKVIIDIDIVVWNGDVIKPADLTRSYMTIGLEQLSAEL